MKILSPFLLPFLQVVSAVNVGDGYEHPIEGSLSLELRQREQNAEKDRPGQRSPVFTASDFCPS